LSEFMKFAVVTGANKGIGLAIVENLSKSLTPANDWTIVLSARNSQLGEEAVKSFSSSPVKVVFQQLDITQKKSIEDFARAIKDIDIFINNAGMVAPGESDGATTEEKHNATQVTMDTNLWGTLDVTRALLPNLRKDARVVIVASTMGLQSLKKLSDDLYQKFVSPMSMAELKELMKDFESHIQKGDHLAAGWPEVIVPIYSVSKLALIKATFNLAEEVKGDPRHLVINACCPGYVATDLNNHKGHKTVEEGAKTPCYLAMLPIAPDTPKGKFFYECKEVEWKR